MSHGPPVKNVNIVSSYYLENYLSQRFHISHANWSYKELNPFDFIFLRSNVIVTWLFCMNMVSTHIFENYLSQSFHKLCGDWSK